MKKILYIAAAATLALASCSSDNELANEVVENEGKVAVAFANPYLAGSTRAIPIVGQAGLNSAGGFGVFAYEQGSTQWDTYRSSNVYPNFFYNQRVYHNAGEWTYSPVKYFSNNLGAKHSFFVYAPYRENINAVFSMANNAPVIRYTAKDDYDLLWAPAIVDQEKPGVNSKLSFQFQHALSKVTFDVAPFIDKVHGDAHTETENIAAGTTITVRSVKFTGKVPSQGLLNLRNGEWTIEATEEGAYEITKPVTFNAGTITRQALIQDMMVIPAEGVKVKVVYDVTTVDLSNPKNNSTVTNTIESEETFTLEKGTAYTFHLDLGLTSVKFVADVNEWGSENPKDVDLPNNYTAIDAAINYPYDNYTYGGTVSASGNTITVAYTDQGTATSNMMNDLARLLGALYRAGHVQNIAYGSKNYKWDATLGLEGSNWRDADFVGDNSDNDTHKHSLVSVITAAYNANPSSFLPLTLKCDGVDIQFTASWQ